MVAAFDYCLHGRGGAAPSIDTAMHGLVDAAHVDHLHPDSGIALATAADGEALTKQIFGDRVVWVPWRRPGFQLGLDIAEIKRANPQAIGTILGGHGITAWGDTSAEAEARSLEIIETAERYIAENGGGIPSAPRWPGTGRCRTPTDAPRPPRLRRSSVGWRRTDKPQVGHFTDDPRVLEFLGGSEHPRLAALGTSCPGPLPAHQGQADGAGPARRRVGRGLPVPGWPNCTRPTARLPGRTTTGTRIPPRLLCEAATRPSC